MARSAEIETGQEEEEVNIWTADKATNATAVEIIEYITDRINDYDEKELKGIDLFEYWRADFENFTSTAFKKTTAKTRLLRDYLLENGVWIPKNRRLIADNLVANMKGWTAWPAGTPNPRYQQNQLQTPTTTRFRTPIDDDGDDRQGDRQFTPTPRPRDQGPNLIGLTKLYTEEKKYGGDGDSFDYKYNIFIDLCEKAELPRDAYFNAFSIMLKGAALKHYYTTCKTDTRMTQLADLCYSVRNTFEGAEYKRSMLTKWNALSLRQMVSKNTDKDIETCLQLLVEELRTTQMNLDTNLQSDTFLQNKLLMACQDHPACSIACSIPALSSTGLINNLRTNIVTYESINKKQSQTQYLRDDDETEQYFTDRRYHSNRQQNRYSQQRQERYNRPTRGQFGQRGRTNYKDQPQLKSCFICKKKDCWSTRHTQEERDEARARYKATFDKKINQRVDQYLAEDGDREGDDTDTHDELTDLADEFEALVVEVEGTSTTEESDVFITEAGYPIEQVKATEIVRKLSDKATTHALLKNNDSYDEANNECFATDRYGPNEFHGIMIDTGAAGKSTAGYNQYIAYEKLFGKTPIDTGQEGAVKATFGIGSTTSIGSITIPTPIGQCEFYIVNANTPFLLSLAEMDTKKITLNNIQNKLISEDGASVPIVRRFGHPFLMWGLMISTYCYLTETELRTLHRRFGHPSATRLANVLERAGHSDVQNHQILNHITKYCTRCQKFGGAPLRFKFTLRDDSIDFNHSIYIDIMYIDNSPILHIVDEATRFQAARWLQNMTSQHVWNTLRTCWIDSYLGPPDIITHDAGTNFTSQEFQQSAESLSIRTKEVPVEAAASMSIVERYHKPLRRAYQVIKDEIEGIDKVTALQMAVKAINDTAGYDGIVPTLLVFGAFPRMTHLDPPAPTIAQRATAIKKAMAEITKLRMQRQVTDALRTRNGPSTDDTHAIPLGSDVLVWRIHEKSWNGPYKLLAIEGETATIELPHGPIAFRTTNIKRYTSDNNTDQAQAQHEQQEDSQINQRPTRTHRPPARYRADIMIADTMDKPRPDFTSSRQKELDGLIKTGVFEFIKATDIPATTRIFNSRFLDQVKFEGTPKAYEKSRLVVQAYKDNGKKAVLTQSPTIQRVSQRLILCLALHADLEIHIRDITQAYTQSKSQLVRDFYVRPPRELALPEGMLLKVLLPLYGVPEAGTHWFHTYHNHHTEKLKLQQSSYDPCFLFTTISSNANRTTDMADTAVVGLQTDDTLIACNPGFKKRESDELQRAGFIAKPTQQLTSSNDLNFNGARIRRSTDTLTVSQHDQAKKIELLNTYDISREEYISQRARGAYISSVCQPQVAFGLSYAAQITDPQKDDVDKLNKCLKWQIKNKDKGLTFVKLTGQLRLIAFTDSSFANNKDCSSQIGYVIVLADNDNNCNIIHWSSIKCKRVTRSVIASELYAMVHGFDATCALKDTLDKITQRQTPIIICIDSFSLYECLVKLGTTYEKRLMIDIMAIRQSYERREIAEIIWITGDSNPADSMTKHTGNTALTRTIETNKVDIQAAAWVERKGEADKGESDKGEEKIN